MSFSWGRCRLIALVLFVLPMTLPAQDPATPIARGRIQSIESVVSDIKYILKFSNKENEGDNLENLVPVLATTGIDLKKPIGGYVQLAEKPADSPVVLVIPMEDENTLFNFLGTVGIRPAKGQDGTYSLGTLNLPVDFDFYIRMAHKHLYLTIKNRENLDLKRIVLPEKLFAGMKKSYLDLQVDFRSIPQSFRDYALLTIAEKVEAEKEKLMPGEKGPDRKIRLALLDYASSFITMLVNDASTLGADFVIDTKKDQFGTVLQFQGKPGSKLAEKLRQMEGAPSRFASLAEKAPASAIVNLSLPKEICDGLLEVFDKSGKDAVKQKNNEGERKLTQQIIDALRPTVKEGRIHLGLMTQGPDNQGLFSLVAGMEVKDGEKIEKALQDLHQFIPLPIRVLVQLEPKKVEGQSVHRMVLPVTKAKEQDLLGEKLKVHVALKNDVLWVTGEPEGDSQLKAVLAAKEGKAPALQIKGSVAHLARFLEEPERKGAHQTWEGDPRETDRFELLLAGGDQLQLSLTFHAKILTFFANVDAIKKSQE